MAEAELQQRRDEPAARVVPRHEDAAAEGLLHGGEGLAEVLGLGDVGRLVPQLTEGLCRGGAAQRQRRAKLKSIW